MLIWRPCIMYEFSQNHTFFVLPRLAHWKKYFNVHFKSQNYSCLLDSHPCLGYRNFCCKKISCNKSKIKAVVLMEKLKQHNLGVKFTPAYFFPCHFDSENKLHWQYSLSIRQYSLSIRQRILLMKFIFTVKVTRKEICRCKFDS